MKLKLGLYPYNLWMLIFIVVPMILIGVFAFTDTQGDFTLANIISVGKYSGVFIKSIAMGSIATLICFVVAYPFAYILSKLKSKVQGITIAFIVLPMWMNFLLRTYAWMTLLENNGLINRILALIGQGPFNMINTAFAIILGMVYNFIPYMILPLYTTLTKLDASFIEAAQDLGANKIIVFFRIILPLSIPGIMSGITMVFVPSVSTFIISKMLGGGSNILIGDLIDMQFLGNAYNPHLGSAISLVLMLLILICTAIMNQFDTKDGNTGGVFI